MGKLEGKIVVVTGASSGLGKQTAIRFAQEGARGIAICARREEKLMETAKLCEEAGAEVLTVACDMTQHSQIENFVAKIKERFGRVDVLINNAAAANNNIPFIDQTLESLEMSMKTIAYATWSMLQLCYPLMKDNGGAVVNIGSHSPQGLPGFASYGAAKAAVMALTKTVAREWGKDNIRVNCLIPFHMSDTIRDASTPEAEAVKEIVAQGLIAATPLGRVSYPEDDIVPAMLFLACEDSRWITGQDLHVEGGVDIHW